MKLLKVKHAVLKSISVISLAALFATAAHAQSQTLTTNTTGTHQGFYYNFWKDSGDASMILEAGGRYTAQWTNVTNNWFGGKGWAPGSSSRIIYYSGNFNASGSQNAFLSVYGWTKSPLVEYYIVETYGSYNPATCSSGTNVGSFQSDGATYNVSRCPYTGLDGINNYVRYYSVRNPKKGFGNISGTVTFANHAAFWASKGMQLGTHDYQIVSTEGYQSTGSSDITVSGTTISSSSSSSSNSSVTSSSSLTSSSASSSVQCQCNWYGTLYPTCVTTQSGWGWENNKSCISKATCSGQPVNQGGLVCSGTSSISSAPASSSSSRPISSSSLSSSSRSSSSSRISSSSSLMSSSSLTSSSRSSSSSAGNGTFVYAVDAGASSAANINGVLYQADRYASGGTTQTVTNEIAGTIIDSLYQSERYGTYNYEIPVSNATYSVVLHFAELYQTAAGARSFSVSVEGKSVLTNFDLFNTVGRFTAYDQRVDGVAVTDGKLTISLSTQVDNATIAGFAIYSSDGGTFTGNDEVSCSDSDRQTPTSISYDRAVTRSEQKNPPSGSFGYAIEHATQTLPNHTIYRPDLSRANNIPIVVWGNGACSNVGTEQADFLLQIASNGYLVIANGGPFGSGSNDQHGTELIKAIDWATKENNRKCSQYYGKLNVNKVATMGWSCGGGMAHFAAVDSRVTTAVALNSGLGIYGDRSSYYPRFHTPMAIFNGDSRDVAYNPGLQEYSEVNNVPFYHANYPQGHGDAYYQDNGGEFGIVAVGWLNYMLKDDQSSSGKGMFFGSNCRLCKSPWVMKNKGFFMLL